MVSKKTIKDQGQKPWREFEALVTRIEEGLCPQGAIVKSPDMLPDKLTGEMREVDASIRYTVGSAPILITIECRFRKTKQDAMWIEQLAQKQKDIGASVTIAVASSSFTGPAIKKAKHLGIELRLMKNITTDEIARWTNRIGFTIVKTSWSNANVQVHFEIIPKPKETVKVELIEPAQIPDAIAFDKDTGKPVSFKNIMDTITLNAPRIFDNLPTGGPPQRIEFPRFKFLPKKLFSHTDKGKFNVIGIDIVADISREEIKIPLSKVYQYSSPDTEILQVAEWAVSPKEGTTFTVQATLKPPNSETTVEADSIFIQ